MQGHCSGAHPCAAAQHDCLPVGLAECERTLEGVAPWHTTSAALQAGSLAQLHHHPHLLQAFTAGLHLALSLQAPHPAKAGTCKASAAQPWLLQLGAKDLPGNLTMEELPLASNVKVLAVTHG